MIGTNGGLIGKVRSTSIAESVTGMWTLREQALAAGQTQWPASFSLVSLLLHGDGANNSTTFSDSSLNNFSVTRFGDTKISTAQSKFGGASMLFDGNGDYLSIASNTAFQLGTGDFTIEAWFYASSLAATYPTLVANANSTFSGTPAGVYWSVYQSKLRFGTSTTNPILQSTSNISTQAWTSASISRTGSTMRMFVNGTLEATATNSENINLSFNNMLIGTTGWDAANSYWNGYIDELRITKGFGRYSASYTPATTAFPGR